MSFFKRLFAPASRPEREMLAIRVRCQRCGEVIAAPIDLRNDLSADYDEATGVTRYICRKVLLGKQRCFQPVEVTLTFDVNRKLLEREISGGSFVEPAG